MTRPPLAALVWRHWVVRPLYFGFTALPLTLAGRADRVIARTPTSTWRSTLLMLPIAVVSFALALITVITVWSGELFPLRPEVIGHLDDMFRPFPGGEESWGGPTVIGAWFIHATSAFGIQVLALTLLGSLRTLSLGFSRVPRVGTRAPRENLSDSAGSLHC